MNLVKKKSLLYNHCKGLLDGAAKNVSFGYFNLKSCAKILGHSCSVNGEVCRLFKGLRKDLEVHYVTSITPWTPSEASKETRVSDAIIGDGDVCEGLMRDRQAKGKTGLSSRVCWVGDVGPARLCITPTLVHLYSQPPFEDTRDNGRISPYSPPLRAIHSSR